MNDRPIGSLCRRAFLLPAPALFQWVDADGSLDRGRGHSSKQVTPLGVFGFCVPISSRRRSEKSLERR